MAKKTHLSVVTTNGIPEAIDLVWINEKSKGTGWSLTSWEKKAREDFRKDGAVKFEEVTDAELKKGMDQYKKFLDSKDKKKK